MAYHHQSTQRLVYDNSQFGKDVYILYTAAAESNSQDYHARVDSCQESKLLDMASIVSCLEASDQEIESAF